MSMVPIRELGFFKISKLETRNHLKTRATYRAYSPMKTSKSDSTQANDKADFSLKHNKLEAPQLQTTPMKLQFNQLQQPEQEFSDEDRFQFGNFVAREAILDEEFWTAAWLRAESHWEDQANDRYIDNYKRKYAEQEFHALKRRCKKEHGSSCIVAVKKDDKDVKRIVLKSMVGTLDVSIRYLLSGESFPGEKVKVPLFCSTNRAEKIKYGYIANVCVAKSARQQGIATNMLSFAVNTAKAKGAEQVFVHVYRNNKPAQLLYQKMDFEVVERATAQLLKDQTYLLRFAT